jgi:hypothetical protein
MTKKQDKQDRQDAADAADAAAAAKTAPDLTIEEKRAKIAALEAEIAALQVPAPIPFPKWIYYADGSSRVVQSQDDLDKADAGWAETPEVYAKKDPE